jgi:uncharacterized protein YkwD
MTLCDYCNKKIKGVLPHKCKFCGLIHCNDHLLPESHDCIELEEHKKKNLKWGHKIPTRSNKLEMVEEEITESEPEEHKIVKHHRLHKKERKRKRRKNKKIRTLIVIVLLVAGFYFLSSYNVIPLMMGYINPYMEKIFSLDGETDKEIELGNYALLKINEYRISKNIREIEGSLPAHDLALYLAKEKKSGNEYDEQEKKDLAKSYGLSGKLIVLEGVPEIMDKTGVKYMVDRWYVSAHTEKLILDGEIDNGGVSCHGRLCILVFASDLKPTKSSESSNKAIQKPEDNYLEQAKEIFSFGQNIDPHQLELKVHELINIERINNGLRPLNWDDEILQIAYEHSQDMALRDFFSHDNLEGEDPTARGNRHGYSCTKDYGSYYTYGLAENIAVTPIHYNVEGCGSTTNLDTLAECIVDGWMTSPGHRENILTGTYTKTGIGVAFNSDNEAYSTQNFC